MKPNSDWFGILVDTFNDKENALVFFTTPSGLRLDMTVFNDAQGEMPFNTDWNTFWDVEIERNKDGWFAEMRIPLSSLQFQDKDGSCVMGLISWRWIARKNESVSFPAISPDWGMFRRRSLCILLPTCSEDLGTLTNSMRLKLPMSEVTTRRMS
jgi:hypothetical protein